VRVARAVKTAMSPAAPATWPATGPGVVALAGLGFLLVRPGLEALGPSLGTATLAAGYLGLTAAGALWGADRSSGPVSPGAPGALWGAGRAPRPAPLGGGTTLVAGLLAVAAVALMAGPAPPLPAGGAALALGLLAAVAEEALFRGALYAWVERRAARSGRSPALAPVLAVAFSAVAFALVHVPSYGPAAIPVDLGAGLLLGWQRWASGRWTVPAATHAAANLLAVILR
jgi:membrane protease YdiL (CAAX protease family)